jgi:hypothetical protein
MSALLKNSFWPVLTMSVSIACHGISADGGTDYPADVGGSPSDGTGAYTGDAPYWMGDLGGSPPGDYPWGDAGAGNMGGSVGAQAAENWLVKQGAQCASSTAEPTPLQGDTVPACEFLDLTFPGVLDYSLASPPVKGMDFVGSAISYPYLGCDQVDSACTGRLGYSWSVEYLNANEWLVSITPSHPGCKYDHVVLTDYSGSVAPRATVAWKSFSVVVHTQPIETGLKISSVRSAEDTELADYTMVRYGSNIGYVEVELLKQMQQAMVAHFKSLTWACTWPAN